MALNFFSRSADPGRIQTGGDCGKKCQVILLVSLLLNIFLFLCLGYLGYLVLHPNCPTAPAVLGDLAITQPSKPDCPTTPEAQGDVAITQPPKPVGTPGNSECDTDLLSLF